jgi:hypothetical protein
MIFSNPFFTLLVIFMAISLIYANYMDGAVMPERRYNFTHTLISVLLNFALIYGAVMWAASH